MILMLLVQLLNTIKGSIAVVLAYGKLYVTEQAFMLMLC